MIFFNNKWITTFSASLLIILFGWIFLEKPARDVHQQNAKKIEKYIQKQKTILNQFLNKLVQDSVNKNILDKAKNINNELIKKHLYLAIYRNDTAIFWSDNEFIPYTIQKNQLQNNIIFLNNTWTYITTKQIESFKIVTFIPIKKEYSSENKYLQNFYYGSLDLNYEYSFSILPEPTSYFVFDENNSFLLSIYPTFRKYSYLHTIIFLSFLFLIFFSLHVYLLNIHNRFYFINFLLFFGAFSLLRLIMQYFKVPEFIYAISLFSIETYTSNAFLFSLGDVFLNSWLLLILTEFYLIRYKTQIVKKTHLQLLTYFIWGIFICLWFYVWNSLVFESKILFDIYKSSSFSVFSIIAYIIIGIFAWIFVRYSTFLIQLLQKFGLKKYLIYLIVLFISIALILAFYIKISFHWSFIFIVFSLFIVWYRKNKHFLFYLLDIIIITCFIIFYTFHIYNEKKENLKQVVAFSLANEKDYVAQMLLLDIEKRIKRDRILQSLLNKAYDNRYEIYQYLKDNYFYGFWSKYDLQVTICNNFDNLRLMPSGQIIRCFDYFHKIISSKSSNFGSEQFYSVLTEYGEISFLGKFSFPYFIASDTSEKSIFIELSSKPITNAPGYPDLLMDNKTFQSLNKQWPNYAKYQNNKLIQQKGDFLYPNIFAFKKPVIANFISDNKDGFKHLIYAPNNKNIVVVSSENTLWFNYLVALMYLFNIYTIIFAIFYGIYYIAKNRQNFTYGFRFKYISTFIVVLLSSYILIALYTLIFFQGRYQKKNIDQLVLKNQVMLNHLHEQIGKWNNLFSLPKNEITRFLITTSNIFYSDVNIFTSNGELFATSRPAFYEKGLKSKLIDYDVIQQIVEKNKSQFIKEESVGNFVYIASYTALIEDNKLFGILQFPHFTEKEKMQSEIFSVLINLTNIFLLFIILSFSIVLLISNGILKPITYLQTYFKKIQTSKSIQPIAYTERDEILPLVNEYNRMLEELARSTEKLLQNERELTWREIARQIAHEIKNPLTPMKLNIQYLLKQKKEKGYIPDEMLKNTMRILLEQIDSLSSIASAFSNFAKMPSPQLEEIELQQEIEKAIHLFTNSEFEIQFNSNGIKQCYIIGDKEYIQRILNNILTNAIQAIPLDREKEIKISTQQFENKIVISVKDNGIGISNDVAQNIFKPSFTTKSSGMGMGLALVKNMVETMSGKIYFESQINIGTTFYIEFPYLKINYI
jgi:signal transduction histidine kinase